MMAASRWFLLGAATVALGACGGSSGNEPPRGAPCEGEECDKPCTSDSSCVIGYHCGSAMVCTAQCTQGGTECGPDYYCDTRGHCREGVGEPTLDGGICPDIRVNVDPVIPTVQFLIDHSGTMAQDFGGEPRVNAVRDALFDDEDGILPKLESQVRFGATLYTSANGFDNPPCPRLTGVAPALDNLEAIENEIADDLRQNTLGEDTPTGEALLAVAEAFPPAQANDRRIIVLATDGEPDTCDEPDPQDLPPPTNGPAQEAANQHSEEATKRVYQEFGIEVYVLSVGDEIRLSHLQRLANAGVGKDFDDPNGAPLYVANDRAELLRDLNTIIGGARECSFALNGKVTDATGGTVTLDGVEIEYGTGWEIVGDSTLRLVGQACEDYLAGEVSEVDAKFECGSIIDIE